MGSPSGGIWVEEVQVLTFISVRNSSEFLLGQRSVCAAFSGKFLPNAAHRSCFKVGLGVLKMWLYVLDFFLCWVGHRTKTPFKWDKFSCGHLSINETRKEEREHEKEEIFLPFSL